ncbi:hypothetical protein EUTSA_v10021078mg [Eutrema salsugineum]|uniref:SPARK domain-containing protein n=1 Tax=Eutrema salsugineum TaxID=72664 RepID=V4M707_EUTSA|nr:uncharacterized GPI-anchored protein At4g28100 [Eutrema salsugineum]ESQ48113.1 hypothetical protein EUTSA_v10021078mg [Eutrema salsugineum]
MYQHAPSFISLIVFFTILLPVSPNPTQNPDPVTVQPFRVKSSPPATIPAFPEQSDFSGCPLDLPEDLFHGIKSACTGKKLHKGRCCPVLGAWLYSAYSSTALSRSISAAARNASSSAVTTTPPAEEDMPLLPDDSETCVDGLGKSLRRRGIELARPNETCDVVYCYCGIRLHHLSCSDAFRVDEQGRLVGDESVDRLETDCLSGSHNNADRFSPLSACNKCLNSLYKLNPKKTSATRNPSKEDRNRTTKMHNKDCVLMGLTWLLAKNRTAYFPTVTSVLRAVMLNHDGEPRSCALGSDGMPLAVDSSEFSSGSSNSLQYRHHLVHFLLYSVITFVLLRSW